MVGVVGHGPGAVTAEPPIVVAVSLDRLTIDLPLAAICIGLALSPESSETAAWRRSRPHST
jgi:hypothetical protein